MTMRQLHALQKHTQPARKLCRHERCRRDELHEAHDDDFSRRRVERPRSDLKAERIARLRPTVVRTEARPEGPYAFVQCPECQGGGCADCQETGEMSLLRWHHWMRRGHNG